MDVLRTLLSISPEAQPMSQLVSKHQDIAVSWIKNRPVGGTSAPALTEAELNQMYGPEVINKLAVSLGMKELEVVRLLNGTLQTGVQFVAPDGEHVSGRAAKRLDEDLRNVLS